MHGTATIVCRCVHRTDTSLLSSHLLGNGGTLGRHKGLSLLAMGTIGDLLQSYLIFEDMRGVWMTPSITMRRFVSIGGGPSNFYPKLEPLGSYLTPRSFSFLRRRSSLPDSGFLPIISNHFLGIWMPYAPSPHPATLLTSRAGLAL